MKLPLQQLGVFVVALALGATTVALAQSGTAAPAAADAPAALVVKLSAGVIEAVQSDKSLQSGDPAALQKLVEERILPHVDFEKTTRLAVGRSWRQATPEQRALLTQEFRALLIRTYAGALSVAREHKVKLVLARAQSETDAVVRTQAVAPRGDPIQLDYRLERTDAGWKIYDVGVLGVWLVQTYQTSFANEISQGGIDGLIKSLAARNRQHAAPKES
ncbi:MAG TPA: ABC transporter substrate-binding protein [Burkholderiaceae bacterium]|nr:ABC transporter substrate-binding protein [Burkholderiaceae bacterium]